LKWFQLPNGGQMSAPDSELSGWEEQLWKEMQGKGQVDAFITYGELIMYVTRELLSKLGDARRDLVLQMLEQHEGDATKVAEMTGSRKITILRLADEGRARLRKRG